MIEHNKPTLEKEEEEAAIRVIRSGWISQGEEVEEFENEFCRYLGLRSGHAVAVSTGTSALFLCLELLGGKKKDIGFPGYVCSALRHAVTMVGGNEKLFDVFPNSPNIDLESVYRKSPHIAIIPHMYGIPIELKEHSLIKFIEDCCHALGAKVNEKHVGLQGDVGFFSFHATKLITSGGQGGMVVSKDKYKIDFIRNYRDYGIQDNQKRFNFQMTDLQAAIGREQLRKLPRFLVRRSQIFERYREAGLELLDIAHKDRKKLKPVRFRAIAKNKNPKKIIESLASLGVRATTLIDENGILGDNQLLPNSLMLSRGTVSLPIYPSLKDNELELIISGISK